MIWFTSDTHFSHKRIIDMTKRPFADAQEMDERLIENINARVKADDVLYHLGDLALNAGVDANDFAPVSLEQILDFFDGVEPSVASTPCQWDALAQS